MFKLSANNFHSVSYIDNLAGAKHSELVKLQFNKIGDILNKLGIEESTNMAVSPHTNLMVHLE